MPRFGTELVIVDDAHFYRRRSDTTQLTDTLRATLRLPTTLVYVGAGLEDSALLKRGHVAGHETVEQMIKRARFYPMTPFQLPRDNDAVRELLKRFGKRVARAIPGFEFPAFADKRLITAFVDRSDGLPGMMVTALKDAVEDIIRSGGRALGADDLLATVPAARGSLVPL